MRALNYHCILHKIEIDVPSEKATQIYGLELKFASILSIYGIISNPVNLKSDFSFTFFYAQNKYIGLSLLIYMEM